MNCVPVSLNFPDSDGRPESWGRFLRLAANKAELATTARLVKGDVLRLGFEVGGERFELVRADLLSAWRDADGYFVGEVRFLDEDAKGRLGRALVGLLAERP
jgi:hypothetical protein